MRYWWGFVLFAVAPALAAPPPGSTGTNAAWYSSLRAPDTGQYCCSESDCRPVEAQIDGDIYEVNIGGHWMSVPPEKIIHGAVNPTGGPVACYLPSRGIMCFVPGEGM